MVISQQSARTNMLKSQLSTNSVHDERILAAMDIVARENFVPESYKKNAYLDEEIFAEEGSLILSPLVFGRMLEVVDLLASDVVLDIGCATGYSSAVLAHLCKKIVGVESSPQLVAMARKNIEKLGLKNATFIRNDLAKGDGGTAKYDKIFINGKVGFVPEAILNQLKPHGKVITLMQVHGAVPFIVTLSLDNKEVLSQETHFQANASALADFAEKKSFKF